MKPALIFSDWNIFGQIQNFASAALSIFTGPKFFLFPKMKIQFSGKIWEHGGH